LPWWLFFIVSACLYLIPFFQTEKLVLPFLVLLILSYVQAPTLIFAIVFGAIFYFLLLIKDLLLIDRRSAYELLVLGLSFLLLRDFYLKFNEGLTGSALLVSFLLAGVMAMILRNYMHGLEDRGMVNLGLERTGISLSFLLFWQMIIVGLFLPLDFVYQMAIVFLPIVLIVDLLPDHLTGVLSHNKLFTSSAVVFSLFVIVLVSARWWL
jgi:hypothetical protein